MSVQLKSGTKSVPTSFGLFRTFSADGGFRRLWKYDGVFLLNFDWSISQFHYFGISEHVYDSCNIILCEPNDLQL